MEVPRYGKMPMSSAFDDGPCRFDFPPVLIARNHAPGSAISPLIRSQVKVFTLVRDGDSNANSTRMLMPGRADYTGSSRSRACGELALSFYGVTSVSDMDILWSRKFSLTTATEAARR